MYIFAQVDDSCCCCEFYIPFLYLSLSHTLFAIMHNIHIQILNWFVCLFDSVQRAIFFFSSSSICCWLNAFNVRKKANRQSERRETGREKMFQLKAWLVNDFKMYINGYFALTWSICITSDMLKCDWRLNKHKNKIVSEKENDYKLNKQMDTKCSMDGIKENNNLFSR